MLAIRTFLRFRVILWNLYRCKAQTPKRRQSTGCDARLQPHKLQAAGVRVGSRRSASQLRIKFSMWLLSTGSLTQLKCKVRVARLFTLSSTTRAITLPRAERQFAWPRKGDAQHACGRGRGRGRGCGCGCGCVTLLGMPANDFQKRRHSAPPHSKGSWPSATSPNVLNVVTTPVRSVENGARFLGLSIHRNLRARQLQAGARPPGRFAPPCWNRAGEVAERRSSRALFRRRVSR